MGISLFNQKFSEIDFTFKPIEHHQPYLLQYPESWGVIMLPIHWKLFLEYYKSLQKDITKTDFNPFIPNSFSNNWSSEQSWKKFYIRFLLEMGGYFLYPNLFNNESFASIKFFNDDNGTNVKFHSETVLNIFRSKWSPPLVQDLHTLDLAISNQSLPLDQLDIYNIYHEKLDSLDAIVPLPSINSFDYASLIIHISTESEWFKVVSHYLISEIVNEWGDITFVIPLELQETIRQHLEQSWAKILPNVTIIISSPNTIFSRFPNLQYDCVVHVEGTLSFDALVQR